MAYTKYSLTPANNNATPPDGAPEGMLPSAVNDTMRDMMAQIRDVGDGIRNGTYTMTAPVITGGSITGVALSGNTFTNPVITGGSINNTPIGASTASTGAFTTLSASGATTFSGATVVSGSLTANTFSSSSATITGGSINSTAIGGSTAAAGAFTTLSASGAFSANGGATLGDASGDALTINSSAVSIPNGLNFDSNTFVIDATNNRVGVGTASPSYALHIAGQSAYLTSGASTALTFIDINSAYGTIRTGIDASGVGYFGSVSNFALALYTNNTERLRIDTSGNVGIGTSSPAQKLDVNGQYIIVGTSGGEGAYLTRNSSGTLQWKVGQSGSALQFLDFIAGAERMRIDSSGNVGIGTSSPTTRLSVVSGTNAGISVNDGTVNTIIYNSTGGVASIGTTTNHAMQFYTNNTAKVTIDTSGNVGIGTNSPAAKFEVSTGGGTKARITSTIDNNADLDFYTNGVFRGLLEGNSAGMFLYSIPSIPIVFGTNNTERMRITSDGNLLVGTTSDSETANSGIKIKAADTKINIVGNDANAGSTFLTCYNTNATNNGYRFYVRFDGGVYNYSNNNFNLSDRTAKKNINPSPNYLNKLCQVPVSTFLYKDQDDNVLNVGVIAQDLETICPEFVTKHNIGTDSEPNIKYGVYETDLMYAMLKAIQEQQAMIEELKQEVALLKSK